MKGKYKRAKIWCTSCDSELVSVGCKCGHCGNREHGSKIKSEKSSEIIKGEVERVTLDEDIMFKCDMEGTYGRD